MNNELLNAFEAETGEQWMLCVLRLCVPVQHYTLLCISDLFIPKIFLSFWKLADENAALPFPLRVLCLHAE
jgi:hypothetical protein